MPPALARAALAIALLFVLGTAACGSGSEPLTVDEYREQADEICRVSAAALGEISDPQGLRDIVPALTQASPILETLADDLEGIDAPDEFAESHDEVIALLREQIEITIDAVARIEDGEPLGSIIEQISPRLGQIEDATDATATELGLTVCGRDA